MALYELRTYTLYVGKMAEATKLYQELGFPALKKGGHDEKLVGYFQGDTGTINQIVHLWKFDDDADRRKHWAGVFANKDFMEGFASKFRPLVMTQDVTLRPAAPGAPHPCLPRPRYPHEPAPFADEGIERAALLLTTHFVGIWHKADTPTRSTSSQRAMTRFSTADSQYQLQSQGSLVV